MRMQHLNQKMSTASNAHLKLSTWYPTNLTQDNKLIPPKNYARSSSARRKEKWKGLKPKLSIKGETLKPVH